MKKKTKASKSSKLTPAEASQMVDLVAGMTKLVERLEALERKTDQILGRVSNLPNELRGAQRPNPAQPSYSSPFPTQRQNPGHGPQGQGSRPMYQVVCADCRKNCEVPFKPGDRPVYCKECFAIRKAGHKPQDPERRSAVLHLNKKAGYGNAPSFPTNPIVTPEGTQTVFKGRKNRPASAKTGKKKLARR